MKKKILLVDDDPNQHRINHYFFIRRGYEILSAYSGFEGLKLLLQHRPALILLDYMMPGMSGEEFLQALWNDEKYESVKSTPVILLTAAEHEKQYVDSLLEKGLAAYLQKPFGEHELINVVENILVTHTNQLKNKETLKRLHESLDFLENIIENFPGALFTTNIDGTICFFSGGATEFIHIQQENILGRSVFDLFEIEHRDFQTILQQLKAGQPSIHKETVLRDAHQQEIPVELTLSIFRDNQGEIIGVLGVIKDLTTKKKLEKEKLEKERVTAIAQAMATVNHEINNPLTPILGNVDILLEEASDLSPYIKNKLLNIKDNAIRIAQSVQKMRNISQPILKQYYNNEMIIDLEKSQ